MSLVNLGETTDKEYRLFTILTKDLERTAECLNNYSYSKQ